MQSLRSLWSPRPTKNIPKSIFFRKKLFIKYILRKKTNNNYAKIHTIMHTVCQFMILNIITGIMIHNLENNDQKWWKFLIKRLSNFKRVLSDISLSKYLKSGTVSMPAKLEVQLPVFKLPFTVIIRCLIYFAWLTISKRTLLSSINFVAHIQLIDWTLSISVDVEGQDYGRIFFFDTWCNK